MTVIDARMNRRLFVGIAAAAMAGSLSHGRGFATQASLPDDALALAQRAFWIAGRPHGDGDSPAWTCRVTLFRDATSAGAAFTTLEADYTEMLVKENEAPAITRAEDASEHYQQFELYQYDHTATPLACSDLLLVQHGRLVHDWLIQTAGPRYLATTHNLARRHIAAELLGKRDDDGDRYRKQDLFAMLPALSDLPASLGLEHVAREDLFVEDV